jgi:hypothetical protein
VSANGPQTDPTVVVLPEDTDRDAHATLEALLRSMLKLLVPGARLDLVRFEPANEVSHRAVRATGWKNTKDRQSLVDLCRTIATDVARSNCLVAFHHDGDQPWAQQDRSENARKFREIIVFRVRQILLTESKIKLSEEKIDRCLQRLVPIVPYYTTESWLYQNTRRAIELCHEHYSGADEKKFREWESDRSLLDEITQPWALVCLRKKYNRPLAEEGFPAADVAAVGKSFAAALDAIRQHPDFLAVLQYLPPPPYEHRG